MPPLTRRWRATRPALAALVLVALATPMISEATPAAASPQDQLSQKQAQAAQLQAQIDANGNRISILDEQFNQTQLAIDEANQGIADTQSRLDAAATRADALKGELASRAAALYVGAASGVPADLVGASDVSELSSRTKYGSAATDEDHGLIDDVTVAKEQLAGAQADFQKSRAAAEAKKAGLAGTRDQLAAAQSKQEALLAQNKGEIATLAAQIEAQKRAADEARARAEFQRKQAATAKAPAGGGTSRRASSHTPSQVAHPAPPPSGGAATTVATAMAQIGKPYVYAAVGPNSFDCSGLTMFAWAAAGVRLPHSSAAQYASLPHVAQGDLQPGDLVFYGSPIHHVGMYIGNGQYVHAPQTGDVVKVASAFRGDYVGGARP